MTPSLIACFRCGHPFRPTVGSPARPGRRTLSDRLAGRAAPLVIPHPDHWIAGTCPMCDNRQKVRAAHVWPALYAEAS